MGAKKDPSAQWRIRHNSDFVVQNIKLPQDPDKIPSILGWSGPARSGTTALLFLLAGHREVDRVYFQPQKTLMRLGHPPITLHSKDKLVCMKETFLSWDKVNELDDPVDVLLRAGVPAKKITWIFMLRDPRQTFGSWGMLSPDIDPDPAIYALWQAHTVNLWRKYRDSEVKVIPFVYELLRNQEEDVIKRLLAKVGIESTSLTLEFNQSLINKKLVPGQAASKDYLPPLNRSHNRKKYVYSTNSYAVDPMAVKEVTALCQEEYESFARMAKEELDL